MKEGGNVMSEVSFTHLQVKVRGTTLAGRVWNEGDLIPLDGSTPSPVHPAVLEAAQAGGHPLVVAGKLDGDGKFVPAVPDGEYVPSGAEAVKGGSQDAVPLEEVAPGGEPERPRRRSRAKSRKTQPAEKEVETETAG
jgi:hypothetical protein